MIETQRKIGSYYPLIFFSIAALLLLEIPIESAIILVFALPVIAAAGQSIATKVGYNGVGVGIGSVVGVGAFTFGVQLLLLLGAPSALAHWSVILAMTMVLIFGRFRRNKPLVMREVRHHTDIYTAASVALVVATLRQPWILPFTFVVVAFGIWLQGKKLTAKSFLISSILATLGWFASSLLRPNLWWRFYSSAHPDFYESLSWSIAKWGIFEHPGFVGGSIAKYHWLTYAFFGGLGELAHLEPWSALRKIGPLLVYFLLAQLMISLSKNSVSARQSWHWLIFVLGIISTRSQNVESWSISIVVALAFLHLARLPLNALSLHLLLFWVLLSTTLFLAKLSTAVVVAVILGIKIFLDRGKPLLPQAIPMILLIFCGIAFTISIPRGKAGKFFAFPQLSTSATKKLAERLLLPDELLPHVLICLISIFLLRSLLKIRLGSTGFSVALLTLPSLLASGLSYSGNDLPLNVRQATAEYFLYTPVFLLSLFCAIEVLNLSNGQIFQKVKNQNALIIWIIASGFVAGSYWRYRSLGISIGNVIPAEILFVFAMIAFVSYATAYTLNKKLRSYSPKIVLSLLIFVSGVLFGFKVDDYFRNLDNPAEFYSLEKTKIPGYGSSDLIAVGRFIRDNTSPETVLASNNFYSDQFQGGFNYLLPAETQRRFLMQGLAFQTGLEEPSTEQIQRMNLSIEFADRPSALVLKRLKEYGVKGYVVNLALTDRRNWSEFATEAFRSGDFVFLVFN